MSDSIRLRRWCRASIDDSLATEYERHQIERYFETGDPDYLPEVMRAVHDAGVVFEVRGELQLEGEPEPKEKPGPWWPIGHPLYEGPETSDHRKQRHYDRGVTPGPAATEPRFDPSPKRRTPRTCGHPGFVEDGRCEMGHGKADDEDGGS